MRIVFWGARGAIPTPVVTHLGYGGNTPCVAVTTDSGELFVFDAGSGIRGLSEELVTTGGTAPVIASILLSHFHLDHLIGLPFFVPLHFPNSHVSFFSLRHPERSLQEILENHMGKPYFPVAFSEMAGQRAFYEVGEQCFEMGSCRITTRKLNHPQGCLGFRLEGDGRAITYATDHEPGSDPFDRNLLELALDTDVLILDAQYTGDEYERKYRGWGHGTWENAVELARAARAKQLVLFHHDPSRTDEELNEIERKAQELFPVVCAAYEGLEIELPSFQATPRFQGEPGLAAPFASEPRTPMFRAPEVPRLIS